MFNELAEWIERKNFISVHALMMYVTMFQTWGITIASWHFAETTKLASGVEIAAVIAAVTIPFAALQKYVFECYSESRK